MPAPVTPPPPLAPTLADLGPRPRETMDRVAEAGFRAVQLSASQPGVRPRDLDRSGRRDLLGRLRRLELSVTGLDLWIPPSHLSERSRVDRAVGALLDAVTLAADLGRCPLSLMLPGGEDALAGTVVETVAEQAVRQGVTLADHHVPPASREDVGVGIDPATWLGFGRDPAGAVVEHAERLASARLSDLTVSGERCPPADSGDGRLDLYGYRRALELGGYQREVVLDLRGWSEPWSELAGAVQAWAATGTGGLAI